MDRVTVPEAAERLGLSENAVRKRVQRDTIQWERDEDGRVYVYLSPTMTDQVGDQAADQSPLTKHMASEIEFLRAELQRKDAILLNMTEGLKGGALTETTQGQSLQVNQDLNEEAGSGDAISGASVDNTGDNAALCVPIQQTEQGDLGVGSGDEVGLVSPELGVNPEQVTDCAQRIHPASGT